eukprot:TRINITY_DN842_c0_g1_i1.p1 TRINITY_DN842_c0_g1~~TRINITY_DN842_c0_g1_i1.p1  ORF type:complete len:121 (-),score=48.43 TRINITY_DN842_c0_g1_i1:296-658(-)
MCVEMFTTSDSEGEQSCVVSEEEACSAAAAAASADDTSGFQSLLLHDEIEDEDEEVEEEDATPHGQEEQQVEGSTSPFREVERRKKDRGQSEETSPAHSSAYAKFMQQIVLSTIFPINDL